MTGGAGFIGSHLVRALLERGLSVTVLDNLTVGRRERVPPEARLIVGDILDGSALKDALTACDVVFHLAARVAIRSSFEFVVEDALANVGGTASVLHAARQSGTVRRLVAASSMAVYADGDGPRPIDENHPTRPLSPYGIGKLAAEQLTHRVCAQAGIESAVLRLFNTYGPGQTLSPYVGVVTIFVNALWKGETPTVFGDGEQCRDFVHVQDVVSGFLGAMEAPASGETFNIGTGIPISVNHVLDALRRTMGKPGTARHVDPVPGENRYSIADIGKAARLLGYVPRRRFESSLSGVVDEILTSFRP